MCKKVASRQERGRGECHAREGPLVAPGRPVQSEADAQELGTRAGTLKRGGSSVDDQAEWSGWSEAVGIGDVPVPCPVPDCGRALTVLVERWAEGEPPHERVTEQVTVLEPCPVHPLIVLTPEQRAVLDRAAVEAFLLAPDPDEARDFPD